MSNSGHRESCSRKASIERYLGFQSISVRNEKKTCFILQIIPTTGLFFMEYNCFYHRFIAARSFFRELKNFDKYFYIFNFRNILSSASSSHALEEFRLLGRNNTDDDEINRRIFDQSKNKLNHLDVQRLRFHHFKNEIIIQ